MGQISNAVHGLGVAVTGTALATKKAIETKKNAEVDNLYSDATSNLLENVYNTTRIKDRNIFVSRFQQANLLAQQRQEFINFQFKNLKERIKQAGGLKTEKGQVLKEKLDKKIEPILKQTRKDLTQFRRKEN